jgi:hypothetical protein
MILLTRRALMGVTWTESWLHFSRESKDELESRGSRSMKTLGRARSLLLLLTLLLAVMVAVPAMSMAAQPPVNLGTAGSYAVLAGETITNTGSTTIYGDVGLFAGTSFPGQSSVILHGAYHLGDGEALAAKNALIAAYDDAAGRIPVTTIATELGGKTLTPGVYVSNSGTWQITGTLTLDAKGDPNAVFVFKAASTLVTASGSRVRTVNGGRFCRVYWQVTSSATLGTNSIFVGHIFALTSIQAETGATVQGQLLARNGSVTLDTNTITNGVCATVPTSSPTPTATTPGLPQTGYPPEGSGVPWLLVAGMFAAGVTLLFAAWRFRAASRRHE